MKKLHHLPSTDLTAKVALHLVLEAKPTAVMIAYADEKGECRVTWSNQTKAELSFKAVQALAQVQRILIE